MAVPGRPKVAESPLELLNTPQIAPGLFNQYFVAGMTGMTGFLAVIGLNYSSKRPIFSGIQKHVLGTVIGVAVGLYIQKKAAESAAERDAIFRHYVQLHPDDFPPYERKLYKDVFQPWVPIR
ncbi:NADH dehydrogenase [ubiquinone] 1 subunit C2 [Euwallacea fornicatus]|uniref:NADH dehydrogenase [ubiquinone] 1 subunit C2 n=1 Tax=Euwallacea fornicatus TaxID=995702 RepID=UPI0033901819